MNRQALKTVLIGLEEQITPLFIDLANHAGDEEILAIGTRIQRMLDEAQQRMDEARRLEMWHRHLADFPETMGNIFPSDARKYER